jgi:hypothetical protein
MFSHEEGRKGVVVIFLLKRASALLFDSSFAYIAHLTFVFSPLKQSLTDENMKTLSDLYTRMAGGKALGSRAESARNFKTFEKENKQINKSNEIYLSDSI